MPLTMFKFLLYAFYLALFLHGQQEALGLLATRNNSSDPIGICDQITAAISRASQVFYPRERFIPSFGLWYSNLMNNQANPEYLLDIFHASTSSTQASVCSVEPGSTEDVAKIVSY